MPIFGPYAQYKHFFARWEPVYMDLLRNNCSDKLQSYQSALAGTYAWKDGCLALAICLSNATPDNLKLQTTVTGIILGLMPTVLSMLGSNSTETSLLSASRPVLSFLLSLGAPVISPKGLYEYVNPRDVLKPTAERLSHSKLSIFRALIVSVIEYTLALAAFANVTMIALELSQKSYSVTLGCESRWLVLVWTYLPCLIQAGGFIAFSSRARFSPESRPPSPNLNSGQQRKAGFISSWFKEEAYLCSQHSRKAFFWGRENLGYVVITQLLTIATIAHIFFGTAIFSSYLFIAPSDAVTIVARYMASAWVCRAILMFEVSGMKSTVRVGDTS